MYNLSDINTIKKILEKHGFSFSKALGQNFLIDPSVCPAMADEAVTDGDMGIIEVGPGIGVLTAELCQRAKRVVSVELDKRLIPVLSQTLADFDNVEIINADILKTDLNLLIKEKFSDCSSVSVCANLPYYITSPVIMKLLEERLPIEQIVVMVQKEAAERLAAKVGTREAGAVTAAVSFYSDARLIFEVDRTSFMPSPKVDSAVIGLEILKEPKIDVCDEKLFFAMVKAAFGQRRKTALNGISAGMSLDKAVVAKAIENAGFEPNIRAEKLDMAQLCRLANEIKKVI